MLSSSARWLPLTAALIAAALGRAPVSGADCNQNGIEDHLDVTTGSVPDCDGNGIPDDCDIAPVNFGLGLRGSVFVEGGPIGSTMADLDGDGDIDLAAPSAGNGGRVVVFWNSGTGSILATTQQLASVEAPTIHAGDVDEAGGIDLVVAAGPKITLLLNRGLRQFSPVSIDLAPATRVQSLVLADLDGDRDLDIACAAFFEAIILKNGGGGSFTAAPETIPIGSNPVAIAAARIDGDDRLDLVTANSLLAPVTSGNMSVLLNRGNGTFHAPRNFGVGAGPLSVAAGDVDGDGRTDVVTANAVDGDFSILLGQGDGAFTNAGRVEAGGPPTFVTLADLDADGDLDLVFARDLGPGGAVSFAFNHRGALTKPIEFPVRTKTSHFSLGDLTGDGRLDIAVLEPSTSHILLLEGALTPYDTDCNGTRRPDGCELEANDCNRNRLPDDCDIRSGASLDCDLDGVPDECRPDCNGNEIPDPCEIALGASPDCNQNGVPDDCDVRSAELSFESQAIPYGGDLITSLGTADLDADGLDDVYGSRFATGISIFWSREGGVRDPPVDVLTGVPTLAVASGDLDGDGDIDLAAGDASGSRVLILIHDGNRSFTVEDRIQVGKVPSALAMGDIDGDGDRDIVALEAEMATLAGILNNGDGTLAPPQPLGKGGASPMLLADVDGDGLPDITLVDAALQAPSVLWNGGGRFNESTRLGSGPIPPSQMAAVDLDGDGDVDVACTIFEGFTIALQEGPRSFKTFTVRSGLPAMIGLAAADFDRDGDVDLATGALKEMGGGVGLFLNKGDASFDAPVVLGDSIGFILTLTSGDHDGGGAPDIAASMQPLCIDFCEPLSHLLVLRSRLLTATSPDVNQNGRPDECDPGAFRRGDSDGDGGVNIADAVFLARSLFQGGPAPGCAEAADADNNGSLNVSDPVSVLEYLFRGGPPPAPPGPPCGLDADPPGSPGDLGCATYTSC